MVERLEDYRSGLNAGIKATLKAARSTLSVAALLRSFAGIAAPVGNNSRRGGLADLSSVVMVRDADKQRVRKHAKQRERSYSQPCFEFSLELPALYQLYALVGRQNDCASRAIRKNN